MALMILGVSVARAMGGVFLWRVILHVWFCFSLFVGLSSALPMCTDLRGPVVSNSSLSFCSYKAYEKKGCCDSKADGDIQSFFESMNVSDAKCGSYLKNILCAKCDQFSADLFLTQHQDLRSVPLLCNSTKGGDKSTGNGLGESYCSQIWDACQNVSIFDSPFAPSLQGGSGGMSPKKTFTKLIDLWQSQNDFCRAFSGQSSDGNACFNGSPFVPNVTNDEPLPQGICLEKIGDGIYLNMVPHPDGSSRAFLATQTGQVYLATLPDENSSGVLELDVSKPFIDLSDQLVSDSDFGLMGLAFHPDFEKNGRFFASFTCDKTKVSTCLGKCAGNVDAGCDPSQLAGNFSGVTPCQFHSVIAEYTVNRSSSSPSEATNANPAEVRRIFTMGLPFRNHHAGQILFGPTDKYLYFMMGDGGSRGDPFNFAQNKKSLLGKIMRLDVDSVTSTDEAGQSLWGNYSIPPDNPNAQDKDLLPEIWALGLRNPWRCSFDSLKPMYFFCADTGQEKYEEVDLIRKGGNYGWRVYEGILNYTLPSSSGGNTSASSIQFEFPIMGYDHKSVDPAAGSASISGGYVSRSQLDPCLYGRYLYADLYGPMWTGVENPIDSGKFSSTRVSYNCSARSPMPCTYAAQSKTPTLKWIFSFGEDNRKNVYMLTANGVYRVVHPTECNFVCSKDVIPTRPANGPEGSSSPPPSPSTSGALIAIESNHIFWICFFLIILMVVG